MKSSTLKIIAIIAMTINHIGHVFDPIFHPDWWRFIYLMIGLTTYPIMSALLVEGFHKTSNRWKYARRLAIMWLVSILPFHYAFQETQPINPFNNIMFTLLVGLLMCMLIEKTKTSIWLIPAILITLSSDWNIVGILLTYSAYQAYGNKHLQVLYIGLNGFLMAGLLQKGSIEQYSTIGFIFPIIFLYFYNSERGYNKPWFKWFFYLYYPLHLILLVMIRSMI